MIETKNVEVVYKKEEKYKIPPVFPKNFITEWENKNKKLEFPPPVIP